jgi:hypothetical protein
MDKLGTKLAWIFSAIFLLATIIGFVPNPLVGNDGIFLTNAPHNLVHLATAIGFLIVALMGNTASINFMLGFGVVYLLVGAVGFLVTGFGSEGMLLGIIHINALDNFLHLGLGITILIGGIYAKSPLGMCSQMRAEIASQAN